jgi:hypothetical protein
LLSNIAQRVVTLLTNSFSIPTLTAQLHARYPAASLIAEFVTIHQERFVVRALVQVGGMILATGMATADDIEQAEDRAKARALMALGISNFTPSIPASPSTYSVSTASPSVSTASPFPPPSGFNPVPDLTASGSLPSPVAEGLFDASTESSQVPQKVDTARSAPTQPVPAQPASPTTSASFTPLSHWESEQTPYKLDHEPEHYGTDRYEFVPSTLEDHPSPADQPENEAVLPHPPLVEPSLGAPPAQTAPATEADAEIGILSPEPAQPSGSTGKGKSAKRKSEPAEPAPAIPEANDRSAEIAKIGLEMKRLGWTTEQGRNYLKRTYGKRSRQELDDSELMDFLRYLEVQISPSESPF